MKNIYTEQQPYITVIDSHGKISRANEKMRSVFSIGQDANFYDLMPLSKKAAFKKFIHDIDSVATKNFLLVNGRLHPISWTVKVMMGSTGAKEFLCRGVEIQQPAKKLQKEDRLFNSGNHIHDLLQGITSDALWEMDLSTGIIRYNDIFQKLIGASFTHLRTLGWWLRRLHSRDRRRIYHKIKSAILTGATGWTDTYQLESSEGKFIDITDRGHILYDDGIPVRIIGSFQDVTGVQNLKKQLLSVEEEMQRKIAETITDITEKERTRFGREMHDNINQILSTVNLFVGTLAVHGEEQQKLKERTMELVLNAIGEIRKLSRGLVTAGIQGRDLATDIHELTHDIALTSGVKIDFKHSIGCCKISAGRKVTIFRILQEQLNNIVRHSQATMAVVKLDTDENNIYLFIEDNGVGFSGKKQKRGIGLTNIESRVKIYNGSLQINTKPGAGFKLFVSIPKRSKDSGKNRSKNV